MRISKYIFIILFGLSLAACQSEKTQKPAHLRGLSMIQYPSAELTISGQGKNKNVHKTYALDYAKATEYQEFSPGNYEITLTVKDKNLLKATFVLGKNGYYTLLATGLLPEKWNINPRTTMYQLKYIFAGSELESTNKNLPQWFMMRDNYDGSKTSAYLRLVNANPYTSALRIKNAQKTLTSGLAYPIESEMIKVKPASHELQILYGKIRVGKKKIDTKSGYIYTAIIGNNNHPAEELIVRILENPSRTLLQAN